MIKVTKLEFRASMNALMHGYGKSFPDEQMDVWYKCLCDIEKKHLDNAIVRYLMEGDDWPSIAKVRRMAIESQYGKSVDHGDAWGRVSYAVGKFGQYYADKARDFLGEEIWRAVHGMGGWDDVCELKDENRETMRAQFRMAYDAAMNRVSQERTLPESILPKLSDGGSKFNALEFFQPRGVGDESQPKGFIQAVPGDKSVPSSGLNVQLDSRAIVEADRERVRQEKLDRAKAEHDAQRAEIDRQKKAIAGDL